MAQLRFHQDSDGMAGAGKKLSVKRDAGHEDVT
jgi:hypothetical protein